MTQEAEMYLVGADPDDPSLVLAHPFPSTRTIEYIAARVQNYVGEGGQFLALHHDMLPATMVRDGINWNPSAYPAPACVDGSASAENAAHNAQLIRDMLGDPTLQTLAPNASVFPA